MRLLATGLFLAFGIVLALVLRVSAETEPPERQFIALMNQYRAQNNLGPVVMDPRLQESAEWKSEDMGAKNYFSHTDSLGRDPFTLMCAYDYCHNTWKGENIAAGYVTPQQALDAWKNSPGHNAIMLDPNYKVAGVAVAYQESSSFDWYWTLQMGGFDLPMDVDGDDWDDKLEIYLGNPPSCSIPPDLNNDGVYNLADVVMMGPYFNKPAGDSPTSMRADYNASGFVSLADIVKTGPYFNKHFC